jgi:hypothetical protein
LIPIPEIPLSPSCEVYAGWEPVPLCPIALAVSKHKIVAEIHGVTRPGNEVVNVGVGGGENPGAIEAVPILEAEEDWAHLSQKDALTAEEELMQVRNLAKNIRISLPHKARPACADHLRDKRVKLAEAVRDTGAQFNYRLRLGV